MCIFRDGYLLEISLYMNPTTKLPPSLKHMYVCVCVCVCVKDYPIITLGKPAKHNINQ